MSEVNDWGVFVDELKIFSSASAGKDWWALYIARQPPERATCLAMTPCGGHWHIACDDKEDAQMVRDMIAGHGINPKFLRVARLSTCKRAVEKRQQRLEAVTA